MIGTMLVQEVAPGVHRINLGVVNAYVLPADHRRRLRRGPPQVGGRRAREVYGRKPMRYLEMRAVG